MYMYVHVCTCMYMYVHVCTCMYMYVHLAREKSTVYCKKLINK